MENNKDEILSEFKKLQAKYSELENKFEAEKNRLEKSNKELLTKLMFLEGIANSTIDGYLVVDPFGKKILQNQRAIELWKIPQEVVDDPSGDKQVAHVMHMTVDPQKFVEEIQYQIKHPEEKRLDEIELIDGTIMERYSSPVIGPDGTHYGRIYTFHDITDRKNFERQLTRLNTDKDRFISILAHDLKNPISGLLGFSKIFKEELHTYSTEKIEEVVEEIYQTSKKTHDLLEDTLLWASIHSKKVTYNPSVTNISEIILEVEDILEPGAKAKDISIEYTSGNDIYANTDIYMLKAILRNLISNSIKFTNRQGKIEVSVMQDAAVTTVKVSDNGVGITPEVVDNLFNFFPVKSSLGTANEMGTGLGLLLQ